MAKFALTGADKRVVRWIVDRLHVGISNRAVCREMRRRLSSHPGSERVVAYRYALKCHLENRQLYHDVMTGRVSKLRGKGVR